MKLASLALLVWVLPFVGPVSAPSAAAQSLPTASKAAEISAFGGYLGGRTDYGPLAKKGIAAGGDFTIFPRFPVAPSLEVRGDIASAVDATEKNVLVGFRLQRDVRPKLHPYADFLLGGGEIVFHPKPAPDYSGDRAKIYSFGGGINIDIVHHLAAKFDGQYQIWNFGAGGGPGSGGSDLHPITAVVGVTYTIPFRILNRQADFR